jgi:predicted PolB exonuclease-like 3'-5' exonuclease
MIKRLLVLDIETVPLAEDFASLDEVWKTLWTTKISKIMPEIPNEESWKKRAGIFAEFGKVICISTAVFYEDDNKNLCLKMKSVFGDDEADVLKRFIDICDNMYKLNKNFQFAGHNVKEFDIPYLCRRMLVNKIPLPDYLQLHEKKPWEVRMFDTLHWWKFGDIKNYISLHLLANVLGVPTSKTDIDGSMVQDVYYKEKNLTRIVEYCERDVVATANIILRFNDMELLNDEHVTVVS